MRKCECGEPIFRGDRDCCDSCFNTGITPSDSLKCVIIYGFDDYGPVFQPEDSNFIGCSLHEDLIYLKFVGFKQVCCPDMNEHFNIRFKLYNDGGYSKPTLHDVNPTCNPIRLGDIISRMYYTDAPEVNKCPYCNRLIELVEENVKN